MVPLLGAGQGPVEISLYCAATSGRTGQFAYVTFGTGTGGGIAILETTGNTTVKTIPLPSEPSSVVAVSPDGARTYVGVARTTVGGSSGVAMFETKRWTLVSLTETSAEPAHITVGPDGSRVYVVGFQTSELLVIDAAQNSIVAAIADAGNAEVAISPDEAFAYVVTRSRVVGGVPNAEGVKVVDLATRTIVESIATGPGKGIVITPDGQRVYVAHRGQVTVIETVTNTIVATIDTNVGGEPPECTLENTLDIENVADIAITPDGALAYRTNPCGGKVVVIDTATNAVVDTVDVGVGADGVAVTPDGAHVYVTSGIGGRVDGSLSVIDRVTNTVVQTVALLGAFKVAISPF